jgi:DnaJ like chaperone protein
MYDFKKEDSADKEKTSEQKQVNLSARAEIAHKILGVPLTASIIEIKTAYRKLIKVHHPDRFANESPEQIKLAHERFLKIQDAYELLDKLKG